MPDLQLEQRQRILQCMTLLLGTIVCAAAAATTAALSELNDDPEPSSLSGEGWLLELLAGHPDCIRNELGVRVETFNNLVSILRSYGHADARSVSLEEQLAIFLYTCVTGLPVRCVSERFQRANSTIRCYFRKILVIFSSAPFYKTFVTPPGVNTVSSRFRSNSKFWPYFKDAIGAIDGSHVPIARTRTSVTTAFRNRKGLLSQNCLFICDFDLHFTYALTGWEGSVPDDRVYNDAISHDLHIPEGKYLFADLSFPSRQPLLVPYRGVRYHLTEWGRASVRPVDKKELFNLRHASARNIIEQGCGVLKNRFRILLLGLPYPLDIQARIPAALCALHNFICTHESDIEVSFPNDDSMASGNELDDELAPGTEDEGGMDVRDRIADEMWSDYVGMRHARGLDVDYGSDDDMDIAAM